MSDPHLPSSSAAAAAAAGSPVSNLATRPLPLPPPDATAAPMELDGDTRAQADIPDADVQPVAAAVPAPASAAPASDGPAAATPAANATASASGTAAVAVVSSPRAPSSRLPDIRAYEVVDLLDSDSDSDDSEGESKRAGEARRIAAGAFAPARSHAKSGMPMPNVERFVIDLGVSRAVSGRALRRQHYPRFYPPSPPPEPVLPPPPTPAAAAASVSPAPGGGKKPRRKRRRRAEEEYYDCEDSFIDDSELMLDQADSDDGAAAGTGAGSRAAASAQRTEPPVMTPQQLEQLMAGFSVISALHMFDDDESTGALSASQSGKAKKRLQQQQPVPKQSNKFLAASSAAAEAGDKKAGLATAAVAPLPPAATLGLSGKKKRRVDADPGSASDHLVNDDAYRAACEFASDPSEAAVIAAAVRRGYWNCHGKLGGARGTVCAKCGAHRSMRSFRRAAKLQLTKLRKTAAEEDAAEAYGKQPRGQAASDAAATAAAPPMAHAAEAMTPASAAATTPIASAAPAPAPPAAPASSLVPLAPPSLTPPPPPPALVAAAPAPAPPDIGTLHKDWIPCFEHFAATPAVVGLLEDILAEAQRIHTPSSTGAHVVRQSSESSMPTEAAAAAAGDSGMQDGQPDLAPESVASSSPTVTPARAGLRHKPNPSLVAASRQQTKMSERMDALLMRLGALLQTQASGEDLSSLEDPGDVAEEDDKEALVNKFLTMLVRELVWSRSTIQKRLSFGRLQAVAASHLMRRLRLYRRIRDAVCADIELQRVNAGTAASGDANWYHPTWGSSAPGSASLIRLLMDISMLTDELSDTVEEIEGMKEKRKSAVIAAAAAAGEQTMSDAEMLEMVAHMWSKLDVAADAYDPSHLPLLTCVTGTLYAELPRLWGRPGAAAGEPPLVSEQQVEDAISAAERKEAEEQEAEEERQRQEEEAAAEEAARIEAEEKRKQEEAEAAKAAAEQAAAREKELQLQRKKERAAARAAAAAAAAAAALLAPDTVESKETPSVSAIALPSPLPLPLPPSGPAPATAVHVSAPSPATPVSRAPKHKAEFRGEGDAREKKCYGPECADRAAALGQGDKGMWHPLAHFRPAPPSQPTASGFVAKCKTCESVIRKERKSTQKQPAAAAAAAAAAAGGAGTGSAASDASVAGASPLVVKTEAKAHPPPRPPASALPVRSAIYAPLPPLDQMWSVPPMPRASAPTSPHRQSPHSLQQQPQHSRSSARPSALGAAAATAAPAPQPPPALGTLPDV